MKLSHFSSHADMTPYSQAQTGRRSDKPDGLWVSVDGEDDWPSWCRSEQWGDVDAKHRYALTLADDANILTLGSVAELRAFTEQYADPNKQVHGVDWAIDWARVASEYQGIIIAPYQWPARLTISWYYGWDCASGCIWDASAFAAVELMSEAVAA